MTHRTMSECFTMEQHLAPSSIVECSLIVWWVGSIPHDEPIDLFPIPASAPRLCVCYPVCGMVHIKDLLLLIKKNSSSSSNRLNCQLNQKSLVC